MQRKKKTVQEQLVLMMAGLLWVTGLLLAGSDNPYMPWSNLGGLALFYGASVVMARQIETSGQPSLGKVSEIKPLPLCDASRPTCGSSATQGRSGETRGRYGLIHAMVVLFRG